MNIIILTNADKLSAINYYVTDERFLHLKKILKAKINDVIEVGILNGPTGRARIKELSDNSALLEIVEHNSIKEKLFQIDLICALPRPQTLKKVLSTCASMGVEHLYLIRSEKVEKSYFHSPLLEENNYTSYLIEGLSQGKRTILPKISIHSRFKKFFEDEFINSKYQINLLAHPNADSYLDKTPIRNFSKIVLATGPEGGWNDFEINFMKEKGFINYKLSDSILRVENAVTAAMAQIELLMNM